MSVLINISDETVTAYLDGEIDHHIAKDIRNEIDETCERVSPKNLILDFKDVTFMDSSGIGLVMGRYKLMKEIGGEISLCGLNNNIKKVMKLAGLDKIAVIERNDT